jgi:hypothetical protein
MTSAGAIMGIRFRKSVRVAPGVRLNFGKKGLTSLSLGRAGATVNLNQDGAKTTVGLPGTGLSYSTERRAADDDADASTAGGRVSGLIWLAVAVVILYFLFR